VENEPIEEDVLKGLLGLDPELECELADIGRG